MASKTLTLDDDELRVMLLALLAYKAPSSYGRSITRTIRAKLIIRTYNGGDKVPPARAVPLGWDRIEAGLEQEAPRFDQDAACCERCGVRMYYGALTHLCAGMA